MSFFVFDWFWSLETHSPKLEHALKAFLQANPKDFKFAIMYTNHYPFDSTVQDGDKIVKHWKQFVFRSDYLKIDGRPVILIFDPGRFRGALGGPEKARDAIRYIKQELGDAFVVGLVHMPPEDQLENLALMVLEGYDAVTTYNYIGGYLKYRSKKMIFITDYHGYPIGIGTYDDLMDFYEETWEHYYVVLSMFNRYFKGEDVKEIEDTLRALERKPSYRPYVREFRKLKGSNRRFTYIVPVTPGWDSRPLVLERHRAYMFIGNTPQKFEKMMLRAKRFVVCHQDVTENLILIEAWNEFLEGSYIEPTHTWGTAYVDAVRRAMSSRRPIVCRGRRR